MSFEKIHRAMTVILFGAIWLTSCSSSHDDSEDWQRPVKMSVRLTIPAGDGYGTRAIGDPGAYERFELPRHLYLYIVSTKLDDTKELIAFGSDYHQQLDESQWVKDVNPAGGFPSVGDSLYRYGGQLSVLLPIDRKSAVVYAVLSAKELTIGTPTTIAPENLTFTVEPKGGDYDYLRDIYSTPYNLGKNGSVVTVDNEYYGNVANYTSNVPSLNLMLYHVAAKIDVTWNIASEAQSLIRMTSVRFRRLMNENTVTANGVGKAMIFRPTENVVTSATPLGRELSVSTTSDVERYFYGRRYIYTIPYKYDDAYRVSMSFNNTYNPTFYTVPQSPVFTPWIRYNLTFTQMPSSETEIEM